MKRILLKETNKTHSTRRMKPTYRAEQLHYPSIPTEEMISPDERYVPRTCSTPQLKLPTKTKNSTIELHLRRRILAQREVHYCWSTPTDTLLECSAIHESNAPSKIKDLQMRIIARELRTYSRHHDASDDRLRWLRMREDMRWQIWDEWYQMNCVHVAQMPSSRTLGSAELKQWCAHQCLGRPRSAFRNPYTGEGYDMHTIWYRVTTIMRGEPRNILIAKAIIVVANPRGSYDIVNTNTKSG